MTAVASAIGGKRVQHGPLSTQRTVRPPPPVPLSSTGPPSHAPSPAARREALWRAQAYALHQRCRWGCCGAGPGGRCKSRTQRRRVGARTLKHLRQVAQIERVVGLGGPGPHVFFDAEVHLHAGLGHGLDQRLHVRVEVLEEPFEQTGRGGRGRGPPRGARSRARHRTRGGGVRGVSPPPSSCGGPPS